MDTVSQVIDAFGGTSATARLFNVGPSAVSNWRAAGAFPDRLHYRISQEAKTRRIKINPALFDAAPHEAVK